MLLRAPRTTSALIALALATALAAWWARAQTAAPTRDDPAPRQAAASRGVPVVVQTVGQALDDAPLAVIGSGRALKSVVLRPAVAGEVAQWRVQPGQAVKAGQLLVQLVDRHEQLALRAAQAKASAAKALSARYAATVGTGAVPPSVIDEALQQQRLAEIAVEQARAALADRQVRAPFDGVAGLAEVQVGTRVGMDTDLLTLDDRRRLMVDFELPELYLTRVRDGHPVTVGNPAFGDRRFDGRVAERDSRIHPERRTWRLRAEVPNAQDLLRPGQSFTVQLALPGQPFPTVPELSVQYGRQGPQVWLVREGQSVAVPVRVVRRTDTRVLVEGALQPGESVVVEGLQRLRDGRPVQVLERAADAATAATAASARSAAPAALAASASTR